MTGFQAALLDWRGTLVHIPVPVILVRDALESLGRPSDPDRVDAILARLRSELESRAWLEASRVMDSSTTVHRGLMMDMFDRAGMDSELAGALYDTEWDPGNRPVYPDVMEALASLVRAGVRIAIVSDIHFDIRAECERDLGQYVDAYILSCEQGFQKPDPRMFTRALDALAVEASEAVMVGDTPQTDGGAVAVGVTTLILPRPRDLGPRGLNNVSRLFGASALS